MTISIAKYTVSTNCATETSPKKEAKIVPLQTMDIAVPSVNEFIPYFSIQVMHLLISVFILNTRDATKFFTIQIDATSQDT